MSLRLPSTVTDVKFIKMPNVEKVIEDDEEWEKCGIWILPVLNNDLSWADDVWTDLQELLNNGCLLMLKASTAAFPESGVILCYTRPGQEEARKTAVAIRETMRYKYKTSMLYKSVKDSNDHQRRFGDKYVTQYMYTFLGGFYARDANRRWKLVGKSRIVRQKPVFLKSMITRARTPLPSSSKSNIYFDRNSDNGDGFQTSNRRRFQDKGENTKQRFPQKGFWHFKCTLEMEEDGLAEADRVWLAVKRLYDRGSFIKIMSVRSGTEIGIANIFCYVSYYSDVPNLVNDCKYVLRNTHFSTMSNFYITPSCNKYFIKYVMTPEEELYEGIQKLTTIDMTILKFLSEEEILKKI